MVREQRVAAASRRHAQESRACGLVAFALLVAWLAVFVWDVVGDTPRFVNGLFLIAPFFFLVFGVCAIALGRKSRKHWHAEEETLRHAGGSAASAGSSNDAPTELSHGALLGGCAVIAAVGFILLIALMVLTWPNF